MSYIKKHLFSITIFLATVVVAVIILGLSLPTAKPLLKKTASQSSKVKYKEVIRFSAIGDSLTEGIGDSTDSGGYVPLLKNDLVEAEKISVVESYNHGKAGDTVEDLMKRINNSKTIQEDLKKSDFITITIGGNDLMKVIKSELLNGLTYETFKKPSEEYQSNLKDLYKLVRRFNKKAPIYQLGIYNPFYLSLDNMDQLQEIVDFWNQASKEVVVKSKNSSFISINEALYKGLDGQRAFGNDDTIQSNDEEKESGINNLISDTDNFHPNSLGYQIIANAFKDELVRTKNEWLESK
ncbi:GDSL-type esterase/lipase family protein [Vagococcus sp. PNs007]|uniref:GDSL-type esterase/lipase family protein n=1 Tax=Vagococcus proximus TaxID=2991417 RepID=A0ABT5X216_9ENTE|nr:GDSL-type esterase/lipase family protein [Vagococcus proximus]